MLPAAVLAAAAAAEPPPWVRWMANATAEPPPATPPPAASGGGPPPINVTCVGDSITQRACASSWAMSYPGQLQTLLAKNYSQLHTYHVMNAGVSGHTLLKNGLCGNGGGCRKPDDGFPPCAGNCTYWGSGGYVNAMGSNPQYVTIMLGTNDAKWCNWYGPANGAPPGAGTAFVETYKELISLFKALPTKPKVYVVLPPPLTHPPSCLTSPPVYNMSLDVINTVYPQLQREIASSAAADGVIDVWAALGGTAMDPNLTCDGCHPKDDGLGVIARVIAEVITKDAGGAAAAAR